jgi:hypothetical protein
VSRLPRLVIRVPRGTDETLTDIAERLFDETELNYPISAVVRGLIQIGLKVVSETAILAPLFANVRVARGRKKKAPLDS